MPIQVVDEDGKLLDAHYDIAGTAFIFHSRGGGRRNGSRNTDYGTGLRTLLRRVRDGSHQVIDAWVDSGPVQSLPIEQRRIIDVDSSGLSVAELFTRMSLKMRDVGRGARSGEVGGNQTKRIRVLVDVPDEATLRQLLAGSASASDFRSQERLPAEDLARVGADHLLEAIQQVSAGELGGYRDSTDYDVVLDDGTRLPPKAVFGLAASRALGFTVLPKHFTGGEGSTCFRILREAGYTVSKKLQMGDALALAPPRVGEDIPTTSEDRAWAEGRPRLIQHLRKERASGLAAAKRDSFRKQHGGLRCERCGLDPVSVYGGAIGEACIEVHHDRPVSQMMDGAVTKLEDLRCLCANCHRVVHRELKASDALMGAADRVS
jgi:hypothetical protein